MDVYSMVTERIIKQLEQGYIPWRKPWAECTKRHRKALKMLDFLDAQKRIYAKLTPLTPKIQAHYRVTEIGTCFWAGVDFLYLTPLGGGYC